MEITMPCGNGATKLYFVHDSVVERTIDNAEMREILGLLEPKGKEDEAVSQAQTTNSPHDRAPPSSPQDKQPKIVGSTNSPKQTDFRQPDTAVFEVSVEGANSMRNTEEREGREPDGPEGDKVFSLDREENPKEGLNGHMQIKQTSGHLGVRRYAVDIDEEATLEARVNRLIGHMRSLFINFLGSTHQTRPNLVDEAVSCAGTCEGEIVLGSHVDSDMSRRESARPATQIQIPQNQGTTLLDHQGRDVFMGRKTKLSLAQATQWQAPTLNNKSISINDPNEASSSSHHKEAAVREDLKPSQEQQRSHDPESQSKSAEHVSNTKQDGEEMAEQTQNMESRARMGLNRLAIIPKCRSCFRPGKVQSLEDQIENQWEESCEWVESRSSAVLAGVFRRKDRKKRTKSRKMHDLDGEATRGWLAEDSIVFEAMFDELESIRLSDTDIEVHKDVKENGYVGEALHINSTLMDVPLPSIASPLPTHISSSTQRMGVDLGTEPRMDQQQRRCNSLYCGSDSIDQPPEEYLLIKDSKQDNDGSENGRVEDRRSKRAVGTQEQSASDE